LDQVRSSATGALDKAKLVISTRSLNAGQSESSGDAEDQSSPLQEEQQQRQQPLDRLEELSEYCPKLNFQQRLIGFFVSFGLGCKNQ
jgi:hypothetical protein